MIGPNDLRAIVSRRAHLIGARLAFIIVSSALLLSACASMQRMPTASTDRAYIPGIPYARMMPGDGYPSFRRLDSATAPFTVLALSGGGADGSFGAGFLRGWSESGRRPNFDLVTGSSVGALIAPFAFLGPDYDGDLEAIFTSGITNDLLRVAGINAIVGSGIFKSAPMRELIAKYADNRLIDAIGVRHRQGKSLIIATTNLDAQRTTLWNMGEIAISGDPGRFDLFRSVLSASAAIPGIFPPTFIDVEVDGQTYAEMHVDGGVTSNILAVPESVLTAGRAQFPSRAKIFVIVNGKLSPDPALTTDLTLPIVVRSFQTAVKANTRNAMIATYDFCRRNNWDFNAASIDQGHRTQHGPIGFNTEYMKELFAYGRDKGRSNRAFDSDLSKLKGQS